MKKQRKKKDKVDRIINLLIGGLSLIAVASIIYLGIYFYSIYTSEKGFSDLKDDLGDDDTIVIASDGEEVSKRLLELYEQNNDIVGWISIEGTVIDYPVMWTPEEGQFYLHKDFNKEYSSSGTLFVDAACTPIGNVSDNVIIYGHNMKAGTMFHSLLEYEDGEYYEEHKYISYDTLDGNGTYEVIAAFRTSTNHDSYDFYSFINAEDEEEFNEFVEEAKSRTPYTIATTAEYGDKLIMLSTCAYHTTNGRYVVIAKKIEDTEEEILEETVEETEE